MCTHFYTFCVKCTHFVSKYQTLFRYKNTKIFLKFPVVQSSGQIWVKFVHIFGIFFTFCKNDLVIMLTQYSEVDRCTLRFLLVVIEDSVVGLARDRFAVFKSRSHKGNPRLCFVCVVVLKKSLREFGHNIKRHHHHQVISFSLIRIHEPMFFGEFRGLNLKFLMVFRKFYQLFAISTTFNGL